MNREGHFLIGKHYFTIHTIIQHTIKCERLIDASPFDVVCAHACVRASGEIYTAVPGREPLVIKETCHLPNVARACCVDDM